MTAYVLFLLLPFAFALIVCYFRDVMIVCVFRDVMIVYDFRDVMIVCDFRDVMIVCDFRDVMIVCDFRDVMIVCNFRDVMIVCDFRDVAAVGEHHGSHPHLCVRLGRVCLLPTPVQPRQRHGRVLRHPVSVCAQRLQIWHLGRYRRGKYTPPPPQQP